MERVVMLAGKIGMGAPPSCTVDVGFQQKDRHFPWKSENMHVQLSTPVSSFQTVDQLREDSLSVSFLILFCFFSNEYVSKSNVNTEIVFSKSLKEILI